MSVCVCILRRWDTVKHVKVIMKGEQYAISATDTFDTLEELVLHYTRSPIISPNIVLKHPLFHKSP